jgi:hypothetical protein
MQKVSITLEDDVAAEAKRRSGTRGLSGYVNEAVKLANQHEAVAVYRAEAEQQTGPIPQTVRDEVAARSWPA